MFNTKMHLPKLIKEVESGEEICITNRGKKVAFIIPVDKYYSHQPALSSLFNRLEALKKRAPIGSPEDIIELKNIGQK